MRGRPRGSKIRQNLINLIFIVGKGYGYELHKLYCRVFPECTREVIYYHLRKGLANEEFKLEEVKLETGDFSWGNTVRKLVYSLGPNAKPVLDVNIQRELKDFDTSKS